MDYLNPVDTSHGLNLRESIEALNTLENHFSSTEVIKDTDFEYWHFDVTLIPQYSFYQSPHTICPIQMKRITVESQDNGSRYYVYGALPLPSISEQRKGFVASFMKEYHLGDVFKWTPLKQDWDGLEERSKEHPFPYEEIGFNLDMIRDGKFPSINNLRYEFDMNKWAPNLFTIESRPNKTTVSYIPVIFELPKGTECYKPFSVCSYSLTLIHYRILVSLLRR